ETIDLSVAHPAWAAGPNMVHPRIQLNATILPTGKVLVSGGSAKDEDTTTGTLEAEIYDPAANTFSSAGLMEFARVYHSNTLLLPDATVLAVGGNPQRTVYEQHIEIYSPPYLFNNAGGPAVRPVIAAVVPSVLRYNQVFAVKTLAGANIKEVVLVRPGAVTHAFDMDQRLVGMSFTAVPGGLKVKAPANGNLAPPGYYMLFIVNAAGVPSVAKFVQLH
ncbi:MAG TPA: galactose oxidase early set domain-containing protein, partial [Candidatus Saccharimonadales bacterium]|nr:galactose oxidase early set domain-containing protein [Candidatus Saccharimonadales bacterium]